MLSFVLSGCINLNHKDNHLFIVSSELSDSLNYPHIWGITQPSRNHKIKKAVTI